MFDRRESCLVRQSLATACSWPEPIGRCLHRLLKLAGMANPAHSLFDSANVLADGYRLPHVVTMSTLTSDSTLPATRCWELRWMRSIRRISATTRAIRRSLASDSVGLTCGRSLKHSNSTGWQVTRTCSLGETRPTQQSIIENLLFVFVVYILPESEYV